MHICVQICWLYRGCLSYGYGSDPRAKLLFTHVHHLIMHMFCHLCFSMSDLVQTCIHIYIYIIYMFANFVEYNISTLGVHHVSIHPHRLIYCSWTCYLLPNSNKGTPALSCLCQRACVCQGSAINKESHRYSLPWLLILTIIDYC